MGRGSRCVGRGLLAVFLGRPARDIRRDQGISQTRFAGARCDKGWDPETAEPLSKVLGREAEGPPIALLVGPTLAGEIASGRPTAVVCACESLDTARSLARELGSPTLRIFVTDDVAGVEVGAALKNVIAVAIGMCDGLAETEATAWTNAKAALFSQGLVEMTRLRVRWEAAKRRCWG